MAAPQGVKIRITVLVIPLLGLHLKALTGEPQGDSRTVVFAAASFTELNRGRNPISMAGERMGTMGPRQAMEGYSALKGRAFCCTVDDP